MTWLADVLAGRRDARLFSWSSPASADEVREEAEQAGWRFVHLDTTSADAKAEFLDRAARSFDFPAYFGRNWDAFADCLGDIRAERGTLVLWDGWTPFAEQEPHEFEVAREILRERAESGLGGPFVVLVREDG